MRAGGTYTRTNWAPSSSRLSDLEVTPTLRSGRAYQLEVLELGFVYAHQHNGDVRIFPFRIANAKSPVVFDAQGTEMYGRVSIGRFGVIGGYIWQDPKVPNPLLDPNFRTRYFILGAEWFFAKNGKVYSESRIDWTA